MVAARTPARFSDEAIHALVMAPEVQNLIGVVMNKAHLLEGIGPLDGDDVRQHLQLVAYRAALRWDGRTKYTTYLWPRLHGEGESLIRSYGTWDRYGGKRPKMVELSEIQGATDGEIDNWAEYAGLAEAITKLPQHLRMCIYHRMYEGLNAADTATRMGVTAGMVCSMEYAAIVQLRLLLVG